MFRTERAGDPTRRSIRRSWLQRGAIGLALLAACSGDRSRRDLRRDATVPTDAASSADRSTPDAGLEDASARPESGAGDGAVSGDASAMPGSTGADDAGFGDASAPDDAASSGSAELQWHRVTLPLAPDGRTQPHTLTFPPSARAFAVRSSLPRADPNVCYQLEEVTHGREVWVGPAGTEDYGDYCVTCRERVAAGSGYGFHVLPSGADDVPALDAISLRIALRDCATLTPLAAAGAISREVVLEHTSWSPPPRAAALKLPLSIVIATEHGFADDEALLPRALDLLGETWRSAGIAIEVAALLSIDAPAGPITYSATDRSALIALTRSARAALAASGIARAWPLFVLGRCLRRQDVLAGGRSEPLATTPHIPGGFGLNDEPDAIFVAAEGCDGLRPRPRFVDSLTLGAILAHELGHYLGLFHVSESDGRTDSLSDTRADSPNLMQRTPDPSVLTLSDSQIRVARRHPVFAFPSRLQQP